MQTARRTARAGQLVTTDGEVGILLTEITWLRSNVRYGNSETTEVVEHPSPFFVKVLVGDKKVKVFSDSIVPLEETDQPQEPT